MVEIFIRTIVLYATILFLIRIMGKREIGQLSAFDLVVAIMIAELAAIPIDNTDIPLLLGIFPIIILVAAEIILAKLSLKSEKIRAFINGTPSVIIEKGAILQAEMRKNNLNLNDLLSQLRQKNVPNIEDVEYAILETSGKLSVILKPGKQPALREDLAIDKPSKGLPIALITDGHVSRQNLERVKMSEEWLFAQIKQHGYACFADVFLASLDQHGTLFLSRKETKH